MIKLNTLILIFVMLVEVPTSFAMENNSGIALPCFGGIPLPGSCIPSKNCMTYQAQASEAEEIQAACSVNRDINDVGAIISDRLSLNIRLVDFLENENISISKKTKLYSDNIGFDLDENHFKNHLEIVILATRGDQSLYMTANRLFQNIEQAPDQAAQKEGIDLLYAYLSTNAYIESQKGEFNGANSSFFEYEFIQIIISLLKGYCSIGARNFHSFFVLNEDKKRVSLDYGCRSTYKNKFEQNAQSIASWLGELETRPIPGREETLLSFLESINMLGEQAKKTCMAWVRDCQENVPGLDVVSFEGFCRFYSALCPKLMEMERYYIVQNLEVNKLIKQYNSLMLDFGLTFTLPAQEIEQLPTIITSISAKIKRERIDSALRGMLAAKDPFLVLNKSSADIDEKAESLVEELMETVPKEKKKKKKKKKVINIPVAMAQVSDDGKRDLCVANDENFDMVAMNGPVKADVPVPILEDMPPKRTLYDTIDGVLKKKQVGAELPTIPLKPVAASKKEGKMPFQTSSAKEQKPSIEKSSYVNEIEQLFILKNPDFNKTIEKICKVLNARLIETKNKVTILFDSLRTGRTAIIGCHNIHALQKEKGQAASWVKVFKRALREHGIISERL